MVKHEKVLKETSEQLDTSIEDFTNMNSAVYLESYVVDGKFEYWMNLIITYVFRCVVEVLKSQKIYIVLWINYVIIILIFSIFVYYTDSAAHKFVWTVSNTKLLLELYKERLERFRNPKCKKKDLWTEILGEIQSIGYEGINEYQIDKKFRNLKKTYTTIRDTQKCKARKRGPVTWEYFDIFEEICENNQTVNYSDTINSFETTSDDAAAQPTEEDVEGPGEEVEVMATSSSSAYKIEEVTIDGEPSSTKAPKWSTSKNARSKQFNLMKKRLIDIEQQKIEAINRINASLERANEIQEERNELMKRFLESKQLQF